jgi:hypothetical protein
MNAKKREWRRMINLAVVLAAEDLRARRRVKIVAGPSVIAQDVARVVELPDGSGRIEYWVKGTGWIEAPRGLFTPDEFMPGACLPVSARTAARLGIPACEL